jgi:hypothetical protein
VHFPPISSQSLHVQFNQMGAHAVGRLGTPNMTAVHAQIAHAHYPKPPYQYKWHKPNGFFMTSTYQLYGNVSDWTTEWHTMPVSDCRGPNITMSDSNGSDTSRNQNMILNEATRTRRHSAAKRARQHLKYRKKNSNWIRNIAETIKRNGSAFSLMIIPVTLAAMMNGLSYSPDRTKLLKDRDMYDD